MHEALDRALQQEQRNTVGLKQSLGPFRMSVKLQRTVNYPFTFPEIMDCLRLSNEYCLVYQWPCQMPGLSDLKEIGNKAWLPFPNDARFLQIEKERERGRNARDAT